MNANDSASFQEALDSLTHCWENSPEPTVKITSYFPVYARLFDHLRGKRCVFIETGVFDGGSLFMWRKWLGDQATIVGVDLNPQAAKWRSAGFKIYIGDQGDPGFWRQMFAEVGQFDALLDDGGHQSFQQIVTVQESLRFATQACVIAVEDTGTSFMKDFGCPSADSFLEYSKAATDCLIGRTFGMSPDRFPQEKNDRCIQALRNVFSIQFFSGIVSFHVDPAKILDPSIARNRDAKGASDFRYQGVSEATVDWPNILKSEQRLLQTTPLATPRRWRSLVLEGLRNPKKAIRKLSEMIGW